MNRKAVFILVSLSYLLLFGTEFFCWAQDLAVTNLTIRNISGEKYEVSFTLGFKNEKDIIKLLNKGLALKLKCTGRLVLQRSLWTDRVLATSFYGYELKKNPLSQDFILKDYVQHKEFRNRELGHLLYSYLRQLTMELDPEKDISAKNRYQLELEIVLERTDVPLWLKRTLFFWDWDTISRKMFVLDIQ